MFWGVAMGAVAAVMLLVGGEDALKGLQTITIIAALPFLVVMIGLAVSLVKDLRNDPKVVRRQYASEAVNNAVVSGVTQHGDDFVISVEKDPARSRRLSSITGKRTANLPACVCTSQRPWPCCSNSSPTRCCTPAVERRSR